MNKITATDFYDYRQCKYKVYLDRFGNEKEKDSVSSFVKMLWSKGIQHEDEVISSIIKDKKFEEIGKEKPADKEAFQETLELMKKGTDFIYQGVLMDGNFVGRPDLLEKVEGDSNFGKHYYIPVDIKMGKGYEKDDKSNLKDSYLFQLTFYGLLLEKIQGVFPKKGKIININQEEIDYPLDLSNKKFNKILSDLSEINKGEELYEPTVSSKCNLCEWQSHCEKWAEEKNDLSLIFNLGEVKYRFKEYGIETIDDLLETPLQDWLNQLPGIKKRGYFKRIAEKSFTSFYNKALILKKGKERIDPSIKLPRTEKEIHFDIEDDPTQNVVYLHGFWIVENGKGRYEYIFAKNINEEEKATRKLWDFLEKLDKVPVYHYSQKEISTLNNLQEKYGLPQEPLDNLKRNAVDLYKIITKYTDWPLASYGLKSICKFTGFKWSSADASGANSIEWFSRFIGGEKEIFDKILKYNKEDCKATFHLKKYLEENI